MGEGCGWFHKISYEVPQSWFIFTDFISHPAACLVIALGASGCALQEGWEIAMKKETKKEKETMLEENIHGALSVRHRQMVQSYLPPQM